MRSEDAVDPDGSSSESPEGVTRDEWLASVDPRLVKAVVKLLLGAVAMTLLLVLVSVLPGLDRLIPATPITFSDLMVAIFSLGIASVLVYGAPQVEQLVRQKFDGPDSLGANVAAIAEYLIVLGAVFITHWGLARVVLPFARPADAVWMYDLAFLLLALVPTSIVTLHVYRGLDPAAAVLAQRITSAPYPAVEAEAEDGGEMTRRVDGGTDAEGRTGSRDVERLFSTEPLRRFQEAAAVGGPVDRFRKWRSDEPSVLTKEERILRLLEEHDGRVQQSELVRATGWSKSTVSRVLSEMEAEGAVVKINLGQGNLIALPGEEPDETTNGVRGADG